MLLTLTMAHLDPYWQINFTPPGEIPPFDIDIHAALCHFPIPILKLQVSGMVRQGLLELSALLQ